MLIMPLVPVLGLSQFDPEYLTADLKKAKGWGFDEEGLVADGKRIRKELYCFPEHVVEPVVKHLHGATHYGGDSLTTYVKLVQSRGRGSFTINYYIKDSPFLSLEVPSPTPTC